MATVAQRLAALEAEVAELRHQAVLRDAFLDLLEDTAYQRGRESILGGREASKPPRSRHLQALQEGRQ